MEIDGNPKEDIRKKIHTTNFKNPRTVGPWSLVTVHIINFSVVMRACLICIGVLSLGSLHEAAKLRAWTGPDIFYEGSLPSKRSYHGFSTCDNGRMYVFGGFEGEMPVL